MPAVLAVSQAKAHLPELVRQASEEMRLFAVGNARRRDAKRAVIMGEEALAALVEGVKFTAEWTEDTELGGWTVYIPEIKVYGEGETREEAAKDAVKAAIEWAELYMEDAPLYFRSGFADQFPYVVKLLLAQTTGEDLRKVLGV